MAVRRLCGCRFVCSGGKAARAYGRAGLRGRAAQAPRALAGADGGAVMVTWEENGAGFFVRLDTLTFLQLDRPCAQTEGLWRVRLDRPGCGEHTYCEDACDVVQVVHYSGSLSLADAKVHAINICRAWLSNEIEERQKQLRELEG